MTIIPLIQIPDEPDLGDAMLALSIPHRAFVIAKVRFGVTNGRAAELAGYSNSSRDVLKVKGYEIAHREDVQAAILEETRKVLKSYGPKAVRTLAKIMGDPSAENRDRIKASVELLNRASLAAVTEAHVTVDHRLSDSEYDRRLQSALQILGIDAAPEQVRKALIDKSNFVEAEYEVVEVPLSDALKDVTRRETRARRSAMTPGEVEADKAAIQAERAAVLKQKRREAEEYRASITNVDPDIADLF